MRTTCSSCFADAVEDNICAACSADQVEESRDRRALPLWTVVDRKYRIGRVLGSGGFGITYLAQDLDFERRVALKEFFPTGLATRDRDGQSLSCNSQGDQPPFERGLRRFMREGQILAKFRHPNIVQVFDVRKANGTAYLAMEFLAGFTLKTWITQVGRIETARALEVIAFVIDALREIHALDVVHRDLKPDNIYITHQGRTILLDFGGAKQLTAEGNDKSMDTLFAHGYAAPEQYFADQSKIGRWTDVYACGATLYKMLTGRTMQGALDRYGGDEPLHWERSDAPLSVREVVVKATLLDFKARLQTVQDLERTLAGPHKPLPPQPPPPPPPPPAPPPGHEAPPRDEETSKSQWRDPYPEPPPDPWRRNVLIGGAAVAVAAVAGFWFLRSPPPPALPKPVLPTPVSPVAPTTRLTTEEIRAALNEMIGLASTGDWARVEESVKRLADDATAGGGVDPQGGDALVAARIAIEDGDYTAAQLAAERATREHRGSADAWRYLGQAQLRLGRLDEAKAALVVSAGLKPDDANTWARIAEAIASPDAAARSLGALKLALYFSKHRPEGLARMRELPPELIRPEFAAVIKARPDVLAEVPPRSSK